MKEPDNNYDPLKKESDFHNEKNSHRRLTNKATQTRKSRALKKATHGRNNNNLLGKKRKNKFKIESTIKLSIPRNTPELPWGDIEQEDNENPQREEILFLLHILRLEMNLIDQQIDLLKLEKQSLETTARVGFDLLKILPAEISTEASSEDEK